MIKRGLILVAILFAMPYVSAEVFVGQVDPLFNLGDQISTNITLFSSNSRTNFLSISLVCKENKVELYKSPLTIKENEQKKVPFSTYLDINLIGDIIGSCHILAEHGSERGESRPFDISKSLISSIKLEKAIYFPGESIKLSGSVTKNNGALVKGFVDISLQGLPASLSTPISKGAFNVSLIIPHNTPSRNYIVRARAYDKDDSGNTMNIGISEGVIKVSQVPKELDLALNSPNLQPGSDLVYMVILKDQADEDINDDAKIVITDPNGKLIDKKLIKAGETQIYSFPQNSTPGLWRMEAKSGDLKGERSWSIDEIESASYDLVNDTIIIINTGNVPFKKSVEVSINGVNEIREVELALGEKKSFKLLAPEGTYSIAVSDGEDKVQLGNIFLTGNSIDIKDLDSLSKGKGWNIFYFILLFGLIFLTVVAYKVAIKRKYTGRMPLMASRWNEPRLKPVQQFSSMPIQATNTIKKSMGYSAATGKKEECAVVALTVQNIHELVEDDQATDFLNKITNRATSSKAAVREDRNTHLMIFSPQKTQNPNPSILAVKLSKDIERWINEYNQKHALKIKFGIGIHLGEMIVESMNKASAFHAIGNTVITAKKAAERANQQLLLTGPVHRKVSGVVKAEKIHAESLWKVMDIVEREDYSEFIDKFMKRQER
ncbi:hypothetical protein FJZ18_00095 [Candidatus Pacearchaeota archaeon]|nr:hypothetical protein [Candidatus Pacearchaeota archaeon]